MYFTRPSFRRGGPTGIAQLTPRKKFQFGTPGFQFLEPGLQRDLRLAEELKNKNLKTSNVSSQSSKLNKLDKAKNILKRGTSIFKNPNPGSSNPFFINQLRNLYSKVPKASGIFNALRTGAAAAPATATLAIPAATTFGLMQMNKAKTVEALEYMKSMNQSGVFDETAGDDFEEYTKVFNYLNENGTPISFTENFASDERLEEIKNEDRTPITSKDAYAEAKEAMTSDRAYNIY